MEAAAAAEGVDDGEAARLRQQIQTVQAEAEKRLAENIEAKARPAELESATSVEASSMALGDGGFRSTAKLGAAHGVAVHKGAPTNTTRDAFGRASRSMLMSHGALSLLAHGLVLVGRVDAGDPRLANSTQSSLESWLAEIVVGDTFLQEPIDASALPNIEDKVNVKHLMLHRLFAQTVVQLGWVQQDDPRLGTFSDDSASFRVLDELAHEISIDQAAVVPEDIIQLFSAEIDEVPSPEPLEVPSSEPERQHRVVTFDVSVSDWSLPPRWVATAQNCTPTCVFFD